MQAPSRLASLENGLSAAAVVVGRTVTRAAGVLPWVVRRASGLEEPSPEAVAAGVVRGVSALAPMSFGVGGRCVELVGTASVLALATWTVHAQTDVGACGEVLAGAITDVERRGLCGPRTAALWRAAAGVGPALEPGALARIELRTLARTAPLSLSRKAVRRALGRAKALSVVDVGLRLAGAWKAMGDAARLVDATNEAAAERARFVDAASQAAADRARVVVIGPTSHAA